MVRWVAGTTVSRAARVILERSGAALRLTLNVAFAFGLAVQSMAWLFRDQWRALFTDDPEVVAMVTRILPLMTAA